MRSGTAVWLGLWVAVIQVRPAAMARMATEAPIRSSLASPEPSGIPVNDRVPVLFYPAINRSALSRSNPGPTGIEASVPSVTDGSSSGRAPAVVLLHSLGEDNLRLMRGFARYLARRGIGAAVMTLPYHLSRRPHGELPGARFTDPDPDRAAQAFRQSAADVGAVASWLARQPSVDPRRIGVVGISLGAIVAHLAMGRDEWLSAGVAFLGGGDLIDLRRRSLAFRLVHPDIDLRLRPEGVEALRRADPLFYAERNRPRRVFMVEAARDLIVPPRDARTLWRALGRPPIEWVDAGHFGLSLAVSRGMRACAAYLLSVWAGLPFDPGREGRIPVPTVKIGLTSGLGSMLAPAVEWQVWSLAVRRDRIAWLHVDVGWGGRGPFAGMAVTLNPFVDVGMAGHWRGRGIGPYVSLHIAL